MGYDITPKRCERCGNTFQFNPTKESKKRFEGKRFCSILCSNRSHRGASKVAPKVTEKKCNFCGKLIVKRDNETNVNWGKRKYCGRECAIQGHRKEKHWRAYPFCAK